MLNYVKIKCTSLAEEAKLIRKDENKRIRFAKNARLRGKIDYANAHDEVRVGLYQHRKTIVQWEARAANLAYGYLLGHDYSKIENFAFSQPNWNKVKELVRVYGKGMNIVRDINGWDEWYKKALEHYASTRKWPYNRA